MTDEEFQDLLRHSSDSVFRQVALQLMETPWSMGAVPFEKSRMPVFATP